MEPKSVSIFGFKSFADETKLEFEPRITAIVGSNGCGKSNIVEAIRWTLGEQNIYSLMAGSVEELIFNGSESRKPLGMADVSLTLSNTDTSSQLSFSEITVTSPNRGRGGLSLRRRLESPNTTREKMRH